MPLSKSTSFNSPQLQITIIIYLILAKNFLAILFMISRNSEVHIPFPRVSTWDIISAFEGISGDRDWSVEFKN
jgi:hypothetical protein